MSLFSRNIFIYASLVSSATLLSACGGSGSEGETAAQSRESLRTASATTQPASANRTLPSINDPLAQLGMKLFFTKGLGGDKDSACVSCHHPALGGGDNLTLSIGVGAVNSDLLGQGRQHSPTAHGFDGGPTVPRNAPTTYNIALWDQVLFLDGRLESLTKVAGQEGSDGQIRTPDVAFGTQDPATLDNLTMAQAKFPVTSAEEMRGFDFAAGLGNAVLRNLLAARVSGLSLTDILAKNEWLPEFQQGYSAPQGTAAELITFDNIARAIAAYERSQVFTDNQFVKFMQGDDTAMSKEAISGAKIFYGKANCVACHSGAFMTDEKFHVLAMPQVGRGKGNDNGLRTDDDFGRFRETGNPVDKYAFRTPTLLNVAQTGPWGHAGAYSTLEAVVRHHLDPHQAVANFNFAQLDAGVQTAGMLTNTNAALAQLDTLRSQGQSLLPVVTLTDTEVTNLVAFLESLSDPCVKDRACLGQWIPDATDTNPDNLRVNAVNSQGQAL